MDEDLNLKLARLLDPEGEAGEYDTPSRWWKPRMVSKYEGMRPVHMTDFDALALAVVDEMRRRGWEVELGSRGRFGWIAEFSKSGVLFAQGETLREAIVRAAIAALESKNG